MLDATCMDPNGDGWGVDAYKENDGVLTVCDGNVDTWNGYCTPEGISCTDQSTTCLNFVTYFAAADLKINYTICKRLTSNRPLSHSL